MWTRSSVKGLRFRHRVTDSLFTLILRVLQIEEECQAPDSFGSVLRA
jgi:hypothetical protein